MRITTDFDRIKKNDLKPNCTDKCNNKASEILHIHHYPLWKDHWAMFTENYYEAIGGYIALMADENYPEYFNSIQHHQ